MKPILPEKNEKFSLNYDEIANRLGELLAMVVTMKDPMPVYDSILKSIHDQFGLTEIALKIEIEGTLRVSYASIYGYDDEVTKKMMAHVYPEDWMNQEIKEEYK